MQEGGNILGVATRFELDSVGKRLVSKYVERKTVMYGKQIMGKRRRMSGRK